MLRYRLTDIRGDSYFLSSSLCEHPHPELISTYHEAIASKISAMHKPDDSEYIFAIHYLRQRYDMVLFMDANNTLGFGGLLGKVRYKHRPLGLDYLGVLYLLFGGLPKIPKAAPLERTRLQTAQTILQAGRLHEPGMLEEVLSGHYLLRCRHLNPALLMQQHALMIQYDISSAFLRLAEAKTAVSGTPPAPS